MTDDEALELAARDTADDLWAEGPLTQVEEDSWRDELPEVDNMAVLRMRRFCWVRGAPKEPAAHPEIWRAMLQHEGWREWLGLPPIEPFSGALGCDEGQS